MRTVVPYDPNLGKKQQIQQMFDRIAGTYDLLNDILTFGIEHIWRRRMFNQLRVFRPKRVLDIATGTGDMLFYLQKLNPEQIIGIDISRKMLEVAKQKILRRNPQMISKVVLLEQDSENMEFEDESFDLITCVFGVRNFEDLNQGLAEIYRVLKPGGIVSIMEFSKPKNPVFSKFFNFYFENFLPFLGGLISKDYRAYKYLPESVKFFPDTNQFSQILISHGLKPYKISRICFGITTIYIFKK